MTIQLLPNYFKKIGLLLLTISFLIPAIHGFLNPCLSNEEMSLLYPYDGFLKYTFIIGLLLFLFSKKKQKPTVLTIQNH